MKRILQSLKTGDTTLIETPVPKLKSGHVLIQTSYSLISPGTEKMLIDFGKASLLEKVRKQPDKVKMVIDKIKTDGLLPTIEAVQNKLDQLIPLGYCNVGRVIDIAPDVTEFAIGDRVISNGAHAEIVSIPKNLCCKIPQAVADEAATFSALGAIALQGIRLAIPTLGESFVVIGLGLIGLLTVQLLKAHGCRVLGIDFDTHKLNLAKQFGADVINLSLDENPLTVAQHFSRGRGVDGVLITASTQSNEPVHQAAQMCRKRGRIILVGVTGLELSRADFYEKELTFQVSCSYGPGRYDSFYEEQGHDYPFAFVRWTEQRNFEAFLDMLAANKIVIDTLISSRFHFEDAINAYQLLGNNQHNLGILLEYQKEKSFINQHTIEINPRSKAKPVCIGFIGSGNYASRVLIPAFKKTNCRLKLISCHTGISGSQIGKKFGFEKVTTQPDSIFSDPDINTVVIATRHDSHAYFVCNALDAKKHVFVEKPLCLTLQELDNILQASSRQSVSRMMVGFNRRFAPHVQKIKHLLNRVHEPKSFIMTVNAGAVPLTHWAQDLTVGGGRIIGEACHFIDLLRYLASAPITQYSMNKMSNVSTNDNITIHLSFADGSIGSIHYLTNGHASFPKERLEIFSNGKILQLDNFRKLYGFGWKEFKKMNLWWQDKGQAGCAEQFVHAITEGLEMPIPLAELIEVSRVTIEVANFDKDLLKIE